MYAITINRVKEFVKEYYSVHTNSKCTCNKIFLTKDIPSCANRSFGNKPILLIVLRSWKRIGTTTRIA